MAGYEAPVNPAELGPQWELFAQITGQAALTKCFVAGVIIEADYADYIKPGSRLDAEILTLARAARVVHAEYSGPTVARVSPGVYISADKI